MADGVFLDLPGPWKVVPSAARSLRPNGVLCSFSPCIEQVQRTCRAMGENGFTELQTVEILLREYEMDNVQPRACVPPSASVWSLAALSFTLTV
jgi:tRNA (adenine57-N1/adenine58-N1)-methyltransferase